MAVPGQIQLTVVRMNDRVPLPRASESNRMRFSAAQGRESDNGQCLNPGHNDGHNLLWRACFGTPAQIWSRDQHDKRELTTEFMFFALLRKGINEELPGWPEVVVVFDGQDGSAQRKEADAGYKANRPADDEALKPIRALPAVKAGLDLFAITWVEISDAEADDVIATLAASCPERDVLIASVDQDYYQLLRDARPGHGSVRVLNTARRAGSRLAGPAEVAGTARRRAFPVRRLPGTGRGHIGQHPRRPRDRRQDRSRPPGRRPHPGRPARLRAAGWPEGRRDHQRLAAGAHLAGHDPHEQPGTRAR